MSGFFTCFQIPDQKPGLSVLTLHMSKLYFACFVLVFVCPAEASCVHSRMCLTLLSSLYAQLPTVDVCFQHNTPYF